MGRGVRDRAAAAERGVAGRPAASSQREGAADLTYIANTGVLVALGHTKILIDALFDKPNPDYRAPTPETLEAMMKGTPPFDGVEVVLVTHNHPDHFDAGVAVRFLENCSKAQLVAPTDAVDQMRKEADWARVEPRVVALDVPAERVDDAAMAARRRVRRLSLAELEEIQASLTEEIARQKQKGRP